MGKKVTIDSATMMNKALELVEAHWLFGLRADQLRVLIHPQSVVHAMVERRDGSVIAQLAPPDMRGPIQQALTFSRGRDLPAPSWLPPPDWRSLKSLEFREPDPARFPAIGLAARVIEAGGTAGAIMNAANEEAVGAFLAGRLAFGRIVEVVTRVMNLISTTPMLTPEDAVLAENKARVLAREVIVNG
jgi:1-deoxy-D-xylulose-5-phosphate reductoisomerase